MTSHMAADLANSIPRVESMETNYLSTELLGVRNPAIPESPVTDSTYTLASDQSLLSSNVDQWIRGYPSNESGNTGIQANRVPTVQRSMLATSSSLDANGIWYIIALVMPLFSMNGTYWRCTPSAVLHSTEILLRQLSRFCAQVRTYFRRMAQDQVARELFATVMDIVLVIYAFGFLALSLYQATMIE